MGKLKEAAEATDNRMKALSETRIAQDIKKYTNQIWLAGLGAFSKADGEGNKYFDALVTAGKEIEERGREGVMRQVEYANTRVEDVKNDVRQRANSTWDKVEQVFDERVSNALTRLGIPSKADVDVLQQQIDELKANLEALAAAKAPAKKPAAKKATTAAKKPATTRKRAPAKPKTAEE